MPTPKGGYYIDEYNPEEDLLYKVRVPSVTTILGKYKDPGGLMYWAWDLGMQGKDYRKERDKAADAGTLAHSMIEAHIHGEDPNLLLKDRDPKVADLAAQGYAGFVEWSEQTKLEVLEQEMQLVSEVHRFGGTPDAVGMCNGKLALLDWKTSNRIYSDYLEQVAAYKILYEEVSGNNIQKVWLLRFGKEFGDFHHHSWPEQVISVAEESFLLKRKLYEMDKVLRRAVG